MKFLITLAISVFCFTAKAEPIGPVNSLFTNQYGEKTIATLTGGNFGDAYLSVTKTLTAAQVIALNATQISLIPAVTGKVIKVASCSLVYTKGSSAFTVGSGGDVIGVRYHTLNTAIQSINETGFIDQSTSKTATVFGSGSGGLSLAGASVEIYSNATDVSVGTGSTVAVTCFYGLR
jgi:hypothetical protein